MNKKVLLLIVISVIVIIVILVAGLTVEPRIIVSPWNGIIRLATKRKPFYSEQEMREIYPESIELEKRWNDIRGEFLKVWQSGAEIPRIYEIDSGQTRLTKDKGWSTLMLRAFGKDVDINMQLCPVTASLIKASERTVTCFFSIIKPHKKITPHLGSFGGVLRYHLGLVVPKDRSNCWIQVDKEKYSWEEGKGIVFDDLYRHEVHNNTNELRVVLFVDVLKPLPPALTKINKKMLNFVTKSKRVQESAQKAEIQTDI
jgi:aspartyl/asparaginyl beta-hydroxylase (cupin superfamily)